MTFSETLIDARGKLGYTQAELASALSVSPRTIFRWEKDEEPTEIKRRGVLAILESVLSRIQKGKKKSPVAAK